MNKYFYFALFFAISIFGFYNNTFAQSSLAQNEQIVIGKTDNIFSEILNQDRKIWVHVPPQNGFADTRPNYPVLYLLDGDAHFLNVVSILNQLGRGKIPEMIIVAILSVDRMNEMTPSHIDESRGDGNWVKTSGGGEKFTQFLEKELIPFIDKKYPTKPYRTFVGHSLGGLLVVNTLINHPDLFDNYISIDPSLWWNNQRLLKQAKTVLEKEKFSNKSLYVAVANTMKGVSEDLNIGNVEKDTTEMTEHIRSILQFAKVAVANPQSELNFYSKYYPEENHGTVPFLSTYYGLQSIFHWYEIENVAALNNPEMSVEASIDFINNHFEKLSRHFGFKEIPEESFLNMIGYQFLNNQPEKAFAFFDMNIKYYPKSANVYDSMGDYYVAQSDIKNAIQFFTKAYEINQDDYTKNKLDQLTKKKK
ncbi:MAG: alpha/beta hydrolase-fold protein [Saprospiraceae bacterium]